MKIPLQSPTGGSFYRREGGGFHRGADLFFKKPLARRKTDGFRRELSVACHVAPHECTCFLGVACDEARQGECGTFRLAWRTKGKVRVLRACSLAEFAAHVRPLCFINGKRIFRTIHEIAHAMRCVKPIRADRSHGAGAQAGIAVCRAGRCDRRIHLRRAGIGGNRIKCETRAISADAQKPVFSLNAYTVCEGKRPRGDGGHLAGDAGSGKHTHESFGGKIAPLACKIIGAEPFACREWGVRVNEQQNAACVGIGCRRVKVQRSAHADPFGLHVPCIQPERREKKHFFKPK